MANGNVFFLVYRLGSFIESIGWVYRLGSFIEYNQCSMPLTHLVVEDVVEDTGLISLDTAEIFGLFIFLII